MSMRTRREAEVCVVWVLVTALLACSNQNVRGSAAEPLWRVRVPGGGLCCSADHKTLLVMGRTKEAVCLDTDGVIRWRFADDGLGGTLLGGPDCLSADGAFAVVGGLSKDPASGKLVPTHYVLDAQGKTVSQIRVPGVFPWPSISKDGRLILSVDWALYVDWGWDEEPTPDAIVPAEVMSLYRRDGTRLWSWDDVKPAPGEHGGWTAVIAGRGDGVIAWAEDGTITFIGLDGKRWWEIDTGWRVYLEEGCQLRVSTRGDTFVFYSGDAGKVKSPKVRLLDRDLAFESYLGRTDPNQPIAPTTVSGILAYQLLPLEGRGMFDLRELYFDLNMSSNYTMGIEAAGGRHVIYAATTEGIELIKVAPGRDPQRVLLPGKGWPLLSPSEDGRYIAIGIQGEPDTPAAQDRKILLYDNAGRAIGTIPLAKGEMAGDLLVSGALRRVFLLEVKKDGNEVSCYAFPQ